MSSGFRGEDATTREASITALKGAIGGIDPSLDRDGLIGTLAPRVSGLLRAGIGAEELRYQLQLLTNWGDRQANDEPQLTPQQLRAGIVCAGLVLRDSDSQQSSLLHFAALGALNRAVIWEAGAHKDPMAVEIGGFMLQAALEAGTMTLGNQDFAHDMLDTLDQALRLANE